MPENSHDAVIGRFKTAIKARKAHFGRLGGLVGTVASVAGLAFTIRPFDEWSTLSIIALVVAIVFLSILIIVELIGDTNHKVYSKSDVSGIRDYMYHWIKFGGQVAIWTRDHTWIRDDEMRELLKNKARDQELTFCLPSATSFSKELAEAGAEVIVHDLRLPSVRFTIANLNTATFSVAVAQLMTDEHCVDEYPSPHPVAWFARDLVALAKSRQRSADDH